jgi:phage gpG-like protein
MSVKTTKDNVAATIKSILALANKDVLVGIPEGSRHDGNDGSEISNAALGYIHEYGAPGANIPARPFLHPGVEDAQPKIAAQMKKAGEAAADRNAKGVDKALHACGLVAQASVRAAITDGDFVPLKPATVKARERAGHSGDKPLIVTGQLRNSVTYVVEDKKG